MKYPMDVRSWGAYGPPLVLFQGIPSRSNALQPVLILRDLRHHAALSSMKSAGRSWPSSIEPGMFCASLREARGGRSCVGYVSSDEKVFLGQHTISVDIRVSMMSASIDRPITLFIPALATNLTVAPLSPGTATPLPSRTRIAPLCSISTLWMFTT